MYLFHEFTTDNQLPRNILQSASRTLRPQHQQALTPLRENKIGGLS
jgi:hypothetical protein